MLVLTFSVLSNMRHFDVPFAQKDQAKALGARFDFTLKHWYAPTTEVERALLEYGFNPATALPVLVYPGEDRTFGGKNLYIDLVPRSCWFTNVRSCVSKEDWNRISRGVRLRSGQCEVCNHKAVPQAGDCLEAHERFLFVGCVQKKLVRLVCLCRRCHEATHYGLARIKGRETEAHEQLAKVNGWSMDSLDEHVCDAFSVWEKRSARRWDLDVSLIEGAGFAVRVPQAKDRNGLADAGVVATRG